MKMHYASVVSALLIGASAFTAHAQRGGAFGGGVRYHQDHSVFETLPFDDGDLTYGPILEFYGDKVVWQIAATGASESGKDENVDLVITPELNLLLKDRNLRLGLGALSTYVEPEEGESDWSDIYYQFLAGFSFPLGKIARRWYLEANASYVFEEWNLIDEFEWSDIEYCGWLVYDF